jgi:DNA topoisomerase-2
MLSKISRDLQILDNKLRFITEVIEQVLEIRNVPKLMICKTLVSRGYIKSSDFIRVQSTRTNAKAIVEDKSKD